MPISIVDRFKKPENTNPFYERWIAENPLVMPWLLHSLELNIICGHMLLATAYEFCLVVSQTYLQTVNNAEVYELVKWAQQSKTRKMSFGRRLYRTLGCLARKRLLCEFQANCVPDAKKFIFKIDKLLVFNS